MISNLEWSKSPWTGTCQMGMCARVFVSMRVRVQLQKWVCLVFEIHGCTVPCGILLNGYCLFRICQITKIANQAARLLHFQRLLEYL